MLDLLSSSSLRRVGLVLGGIDEGGLEWFAYFVPFGFEALRGCIFGCWVGVFLEGALDLPIGGVFRYCLDISSVGVA